MQHGLLWYINVIWTYLKAFLESQFLHAVLYTAIVTYTVNGDTNPADCYVPKSKRPMLTRMVYEYCGLLKSWIKPMWDKQGDFVYSMKMKNHRCKRKISYSSSGSKRQARKEFFIFQFKKKRKNCYLICIICITQASNSLHARHANFDADSTLIQ